MMGILKERDVSVMGPAHDWTQFEQRGPQSKATSLTRLRSVRHGHISHRGGGKL